METLPNILKFKTCKQVSEYFSDNERCVEFIKKMRWGNKVSCIYCKCSKVYTLNGKHKRFKCSDCKKQFSIIKGTIFENSPISLNTWFEVIYTVITKKKGISSCQLATDIGVTQKTAWFMLHRIRFMLKDNILQQKLTGTVQCDETFVGGKNKNRHWDKKVKNSQGRSFKDKTPVFGMFEQAESYTIERPHKVIADRIVKEKIITKHSRLLCKVVANTQGKTLKPLIYQSVSKGTTLVTDEWQAYNGLTAIYDHYVVNHKMGQYAIDGYSSNAVENAWSHFKRIIIGTVHNVSRRHLHRYVAEFQFRFNRRHLTKEELFEDAFARLERRLTWKDLTEKKYYQKLKIAC